jgi:hypothetical protein
LLGGYGKGSIERWIGGAYPKVRVEDQERTAHCSDDGLGVVSSMRNRISGSLHVVDIEQGENETIDPILCGSVGTHAELIPVTRLVLYFLRRCLQ